MTPEELSRQLQEFQERFKSFMEQRQQEDAARPIGRTYDLQIDETKADPLQQNDEKTQQIDLEFDEDLEVLEVQNLRDGADFEIWLKAEREQMRGEDGVQHVQIQTAQPSLVPSFAKVPFSSQEIVTTQRAPGFTERESLRNDAGDEMRRQFGQDQEREHDRRLDVLHNSVDSNRSQLKAEFQFAKVRQREQRDYFEPLPWETKAEAHESGQRALEHAQERTEAGRQRDKNLEPSGFDADDPKRSQ